MKKAELRKAAIKQREALTTTALEELTLQLLAHFAKLDFTGIRVIHIFLPIEKKKEPDTFLFISWLRQNHPSIKIVVPRADFATSLMTHHHYKGLESLKKNLYDILEPESNDPHLDAIDLVLVPLLAFDLKGCRIGYGKGFYDRFLQSMPTKKVGLSLFAPVKEIADTDVNDVRMDICLTPERVYVFN